MYEKHFGLGERPFNLTPDPRYLFLSPRHQEAFALLQYGVREKQGFVLLTGEVGTGKTTLLRHFLAQVGPGVRTAVVLYPAVSAGDLFHTILEDLGVPFEGGTLRQAVQALHASLLEARGRGEHVAVIIDEAQTLHPKVLEQLRLLSNLETERDKLLTIVLCGQPELREILDRADLRQLAQRVTVRAHLEPLTREDTADYVRHRLRVAGGSGNELDAEAIDRLAEWARGVPRLVNLLADRAMLGAFGRQLQRVPPSLVDEAAAEILPRSHASRGFPPALLRWALGGAGVLVLALAVRDFAPTLGVDPPPVSTAMTAGTPPGPPPAIRCRDSEASRAAAVAAVERFWDSPGFEAVSSSSPLPVLARLGLPAVARMRGASGTCFVALLPADGVTFEVVDDSGRYTVELSAAERAYNARFDVTLVDRAHALLIQEPRAQMRWARETLVRRRLLARGASDAAFRAALAGLAEVLGRPRESPAQLDPLMVVAIAGPAPKREGAPTQ